MMEQLEPYLASGLLRRSRTAPTGGFKRSLAATQPIENEWILRGLAMASLVSDDSTKWKRLPRGAGEKIKATPRPDYPTGSRAGSPPGPAAIKEIPG